MLVTIMRPFSASQSACAEKIKLQYEGQNNVYDVFEKHLTPSAAKRGKIPRHRTLQKGLEKRAAGAGVRQYSKQRG